MYVPPSVRVLTTLSLLVAGLAVTVPLPAATADDPVVEYPFENETYDLVDQPTYPSSLVTSGGQGHYAQQTYEGVVAAEFGITAPGDVTDGHRERWADDEAYLPMEDNAPQVAGADDVAIGDLDVDGSVDAAYLVTGSGTDRIEVAGPQEDGFPELASVPIPPDARGISVTERAVYPGGQVQPAYVFVFYGTDVNESPTEVDYVKAYTLTPGETELTEVPQVTFDIGGGVPVDLHHRPTWLDPGQSTSFPLYARATTLAALADHGGTPDKLTSRFMQVSGTASVVQASPEIHTFDLTASTDATWDSGSIRYDWLFAPSGYYNLAFTGRDSLGNNKLASVSLVDSPGFGGGALPVAEVADDGTRCGTDGPLSIDVDHYEGNTLVGCASVDERAGQPDRLVQAVARIADGDPPSVIGGGPLPAEWLPTRADEVAGAAELSTPQVRVIPACVWLRRNVAPGDPVPACSTNTSGFTSLEWAGNATLLTTVAAASADGSPADAGYQASASWLDADAVAGNDAGSFWYSELEAPITATGSAPLLVAPLPPIADVITVHVPDDPVGNPPVLTTSQPIPVAFLAAPPQVGGAGQEGDAPEFASTAGSGSGSSTSTSARFGVHFGMEWEDPIGANGVSGEVSLEEEVENESSIDRTISTAQAFRGLVDEDAVVYRRVPIEQWRGTVTGSSTGVGIGTPMTVDLIGDRIITSAASVSSMALAYPDLYGEDGRLRPVLDAVFSHEVGDPGSYLEDDAGGLAIDGYCDGTRVDGGDRELRRLPSVVALNAWIEEPPPPPLPDILVSDTHQVLTGTGNAEGASFGIENSQTNSRVQTTSIDVDVSFRVGYFSGGVTGGHSWGSGWSSTIASGVEFASYVGHIPSDNPAMQSETYSWRSFLCQKTVSDELGIPVSAWVFSYATDGYTGSGGLDELAPVVATGPVESDSTDPAATELSWNQDSGTVETYEWRLEAVGVQDKHSGEIAYDTPRQSKELNPLTHTVPVGATLLQGQLYRWKVVATDFFDNEVSSDWEYFVTDGTSGGLAARDDRAAGTEDTPLTIDVVANDLNPGNGSLDLAVVDTPLNGRVTVADGKILYRPRADTCGHDSFDYRIVDSAARRSTASVTVKVRCANDRPIAERDYLELQPGATSLFAPAPGLLAGDHDADGDLLTAKLVRAPRSVRVKLGPRGALILTLKRGFDRPGKVKLRYRACDRHACSAPASAIVVFR